MTSEVVILNRIAVALAADSAVTIEMYEGRKVYNTANKLFALSKYHPVGVMVYGNANLMGIPWESIIKIYRNVLGKTRFDALENYATHFIDFLENNKSLFSEELQETYFSGTIQGYFDLINDEILARVSDIIDSEGKIQDHQVLEVIVEIINDHYELWEAEDTLPSVPVNYIQETIDKCKHLIEQASIRFDSTLKIA